jgi:ribosomal protein S18 acetylase RimI-like enzyme
MKGETPGAENVSDIGMTTAMPPPVRLGDPEWTLAHFTLAADLTALREECRFARSGEAVMACYRGLPFPALSFLGDSADLLAAMAAKLIARDETFYLLLNEHQALLAERAFAVKEVQPEWQMLFAGDPAELDPDNAVLLGPEALPQVQDLAAEVGLMALEANPFQHGPAFGVWEQDRLVAMGTTHLQIPGAAEIGNIATRAIHRRRGHARQVVQALVQAHAAQGGRIFLMVFQTNRAAIRLYESLGFICLRPMFLMRCRLHPKRSSAT